MSEKFIIGDQATPGEIIHGYEVPETGKIGGILSNVHMWKRACAKNSRICRYCHPEASLVKADIEASCRYIPSYTSEVTRGLILDAPGQGYTKHSAQIDIYESSGEHNPENDDYFSDFLIYILSQESRYRNKLYPRHIEEVRTNIENGKLYSKIYTKINKNLGVLLDKDGVQCPYVATGIDVALHTLGMCCRGCLERHHKIRRESNLTIKQIEQLSRLVVYYFVEFLNISEDNATLSFMSNKPQYDPKVHMYYQPGKYLITKDSDGFNVQLTDKSYEKLVGNCDILKRDIKNVIKQNPKLNMHMILINRYGL